ncbi:unnamed protein product, partial [Symbiodinium sp. KB8]
LGIRAVGWSPSLLLYGSTGVLTFGFGRHRCVAARFERSAVAPASEASIRSSFCRASEMTRLFAQGGGTGGDTTFDKHRGSAEALVYKEVPRIPSFCSCPFEVMRRWLTGGTGWEAGAPIEQMHRRIRLELKMVAGISYGSKVLSPNPAVCLVVRQSVCESLHD